MGLAGSIGAQLDALEEFGTEPFDGDSDNSAGNALEDTGHPNDPTTDTGSPSTYNSRSRFSYSYEGSNRRAFEMWQEGMYTTREFQRSTEQGNGTAALELGSSGGMPTNNTALLVVAGLAGVTLLAGVLN